MPSPIDTINVCIPVVSALIERVQNGQRELLVQTSWKLGISEYSGTLEIPAGWIHRYENVYEAVKREVFEETGLIVTRIVSDKKTKIYWPKDDANFAFQPFCCQQQLKWWKPWVWFVFLCEVEPWELREQESETRDVRWMPIDELRSIFTNTPEKIFTLQLGVLEMYFNHIDDARLS